MAPRISACLIVRDEQAFLPGCLRSLTGAVDEIIVLDTGSTDATPQIAQDAGARVTAFRWCDDFSAARNAALDLATGDWVFAIDADERLMHGHGQFLRQMCAAVEPDIYGMGVYCYSPVLDGTCSFPLRVAQAWEPDVGTVIAHSVLRVHRRLPGIHWQNRAHEHLTPSIEALGGRAVKTPISIWHEGYRESHVRAQDKLARNRRIQEMDLAEHPDDPWVRYNMGRTLAAMDLLAQADEQFTLAAEMSAPDAIWRPVMFRDWEMVRARQAVAS